MVLPQSPMTSRSLWIAVVITAAGWSLAAPVARAQRAATGSDDGRPRTPGNAAATTPPSASSGAGAGAPRPPATTGAAAPSATSSPSGDGEAPADIRLEGALGLRGQTIGRIDVSHSGTIDRKKLLELAGLKVGEPLSIAAIREAITRIYASDLVSNVIVRARREQALVVLELGLVPRVRLSELLFRGNSTLGSAELRKDFNFTADQEYSPDVLESLERSIADSYRRRGYHKIRVDMEVREEPGGERVRIEAEINEGQPTRVRTITFDKETGYPKPLLLRELKLAEGDVLDRERIRAGLDNLRDFFRRQGYYEVQVPEPVVTVASDDGGATVAFSVDAGPHVTVRFIDAQGFSKVELLARLKLEDERRIDAGTVPVLRERLQRTLQEMGFLRASVVSTLQARRDPKPRKRLAFRILPGPRVRVMAVTFPGAKAFPESRLREVVLSLVEERVSKAGLFERIFPEQVRREFGLGASNQGVTTEGYAARPLSPRSVYLERAYKDASEDIAQLYKARGFTQIAVGEPRIIELPGSVNLRVELPITEGPRSTLRKVSFSGNFVLRSDELRSEISLNQDAPYNPTTIEEARRRLVKAYERRGYIYTTVEDAETFEGPGREHVDVTFQVTESRQVYVGQVKVTGRGKTQLPVIQDALVIRAGDIYSTDKISESQQNLFTLGLFSTASIDPANREPERFKNLVVSVAERAPGSVETGVGFSIGDGPRAFLNVGYLNLLGYNLRALLFLKLNYQLFLYADTTTASSRRAELDFNDLLERQASFSLQYPKILGLTVPLGARLDITHQGRAQLAFALQKLGAQASLELKLHSRFNIQAQYEYEYSYLKLPGALQAFFRDVDSSPFILQKDKELLKRTTVGALNLSSPRLIATLDLRDSPFNPRYGVLATILGEYTASLDGRNVSYFKLQGTLTGHIPIAKQHQFALQFSAGGILHTNSGSKTPGHRSLFLGGRASIRGYTEEAIIPEGRPITASEADNLFRTGLAPTSAGGEIFFFAKAEYRFPLSGKLEGALFYDLGNLWLNSESFNFARLPRMSSGFGIRFPTPVGPLSLDVAFPLTRRFVNAEDPLTGQLRDLIYEGFVAVHFSIGVF